MLKKIAVSDLRLGMHLHAFDAAWIDHPFWRSRFTLENPSDLALVRASKVRACWIDTDKGCDVETPAPDVPAAPEPAAEVLVEPLPPAPPPQRTPFASELVRAAALCRQAKAAVIEMFAEARLGHALDTQQCRSMVDEIASSVYRNPGALVSLARLKTADEYSYMHSVAVCALMVSLGRTLGLDEAQCREAGLAGLLHDMGKALMPIEVLNKPGKLTDEEFAIMRSHPERGHELLVEGGGAGAMALDVCLHHHERPDGRGYPHGLQGDALSLHARMGTVCDVYDAITSNRPYKAGWDPGESVARMATWKGQFDGPVFAAFVRSVGIYPVGSLVRLASGRLAVVVDQHADALTTPIVKVLFSTQSKQPIAVETIDLARSHDRIVCRESRSAWNLPNIEQVWAGDTLI
jgi:HD-GYP domain-containing protein (c-di-GMP phosphodiesterase class II)